MQAGKHWKLNGRLPEKSFVTDWNVNVARTKELNIDAQCTLGTNPGQHQKKEVRWKWRDHDSQDLISSDACTSQSDVFLWCKSAMKAVSITTPVGVTLVALIGIGWGRDGYVFSCITATRHKIAQDAQLSSLFQFLPRSSCDSECWERGRASTHVLFVKHLISIILRSHSYSLLT